MDTQFSERLKIIRTELGWSQQRAADAIGVRREMWAKYESGSEPGAKAIAGMITAGIDVKFVLTGIRESVKDVSQTETLYTENELEKAIRKTLVDATRIEAIEIHDEKTFELLVMMTMLNLQKAEGPKVEPGSLAEGRAKEA